MEFIDNSLLSKCETAPSTSTSKSDHLDQATSSTVSPKKVITITRLNENAVLGDLLKVSGA